MAVVILDGRRRVNCFACDSWFYVEYDQEGRPMHDCPTAGMLSLPLSPFPTQQANPAT